MARLPRFVIPDQPQHVIVRGNNRDPIFLADEDYQFYLENSNKPVKSMNVICMLKWNQGVIYGPPHNARKNLSNNQKEICAHISGLLVSAYALWP